MSSALTGGERRPFYDPTYAVEADCQYDGYRMRYDPSEGAWICRGCINRYELAQRRKATPSEIRMDRRTQGGTVEPLTRRVYVKVAASGPCVYCGDLATHADHVRPLCDGGLDELDNLVPACKSCNLGKGSRPLSQWRADRVIHGMRRSPIVAAEFERLTATP